MIPLVMLLLILLPLRHMMMMMMIYTMMMMMMLMIYTIIMMMMMTTTISRSRGGVGEKVEQVTLVNKKREGLQGDGDAENGLSNDCLQVVSVIIDLAWISFCFPFNDNTEKHTPTHTVPFLTIPQNNC